ncbi:MAG: methyltransferase (TIGR00027 family) [Phenylobacterium sp.]|jgi:methyltransferase (TIGR00027 family)
MKEDKANSTAFTVLQGLLYTAQSEEHGYLVPENMVAVGKQILGGSIEGQKRLKQLHSPLVSMSVKLKEYLMLPGITLHYVLRKRYIEDQTREAIYGGVTQVVNICAKFDPLAWILHQQYPEVNFIEIDHPDTQKIKTEALLKGAGPEGADAKLADNMHFLGIDFAEQNLESGLSGCADFDPARPTLYICEGVMMYLEAAELSSIFDTINTLTGPGSLLLFTCIEPEGSENSNVRGLLFRYLQLIGEPVVWELESEAVPTFLHNFYCETLAVAATDELVKRYIKKDTNYTFHHGEYVVLGRFSD